MARITITTVEELTVFIYTEFSFDDKEVNYDLTQRGAWALNNQDRVEKVQYTLDRPSITEEEANAIYRHGRSIGALTRRVQVKLGDYEYDSMKAAGIDEGKIDADYLMNNRKLEEAKRAIEAAQAQYERLLLRADVPEGAATNNPSRI